MDFQIQLEILEEAKTYMCICTEPHRPIVYVTFVEIKIDFHNISWEFLCLFHCFIVSNVFCVLLMLTIK